MSCSCCWKDPFARLFPKFRTFDLYLNIRIYLLLEILVFFLISAIYFLNSYSPNRIYKFCNIKAAFFHCRGLLNQQRKFFWEFCSLNSWILVCYWTSESTKKILLRILFSELVDSSVLLDFWINKENSSENFVLWTRGF